MTIFVRKMIWKTACNKLFRRRIQPYIVLLLCFQYTAGAMFKNWHMSVNAFTTVNALQNDK